jgi:hypothetical protein
MYVVVRTRSGRPEARWRSMSGLNLSRPESLMNEQRRSIRSALANSLARWERTLWSCAFVMSPEDRSEPLGGVGAAGATPGDPRCDPAEDPLPQHRLPRPELPLGREPLEHRPGEGHLLAGVGARADRHPGRVADQRDELFVDVEVLADVREVDGVRRLEVREPGLERLGDELVVDAGREGRMGAAPDGHGGSLLGR